MAVEYAYRQTASLGVVWVFAAEDPLTLTTGFTELATALGVGDRPAGRYPSAAVHGALAARPGGWLLVFDNVTSADSVRDLIPLPATARC